MYLFVDLSIHLFYSIYSSPYLFLLSSRPPKATRRNALPREAEAGPPASAAPRALRPYLGLASRLELLEGFPPGSRVGRDGHCAPVGHRFLGVLLHDVAVVAPLQVEFQVRRHLGDFFLLTPGVLH